MHGENLKLKKVVFTVYRTTFSLKELNKIPVHY